ncbi:Esa1p-associated factor [Lobaria immixta]|nr:Esa1p-associated factor [Lobaria immixta]
MASSCHLTYAKNEQVFCFQYELLHEAKVLESRLSDPTDKDSVCQYLVHCKGWKKTLDGWVPHDHLRKFNDTNRELAKKLKNETKHPRKRTALGLTTISPKKKAADSDPSSTRGREERNSSVPTTPRGQKRGRDLEIENIGHFSSLSRPYSMRSEDSPLGPSPESSPGLPGFPKLVRRNNSRVNRSPLRLTWESPEPPAKRLRESAEGAENSKELLGSSSSLSSAPPSPNLSKSKSEEPNLRKTRTRARANHPIFGDAVLGTKFRSENDPCGMHAEYLDYPCERLDNVMHHRLEYPIGPSPYLQPHFKARKDFRGNAAKQLFFKLQHDSGKLVTAGFPKGKKAKAAMFPPPPPPPPKQTGRKKALRKPKETSKPLISTLEGEKEIENAEGRKESEEEVGNVEETKESEEDVENVERREESEEEEIGSPPREEMGGDVEEEEE